MLGDINRKTILLHGSNGISDARHNEGFLLFLLLLFFNLLKERIHIVEQVEIEKHTPSGLNLFI